MAIIRKLEAFGLLLALCGTCMAQDWGRRINELQANIDALEDRLAQTEANITSLKLGLIGPDRGGPPLAEARNMVGPVLLDSYVTNVSTNATLVSESLEWYTNNWQVNLHGFVTNGDYVTLTSTNFGYITNGLYSALVRHVTTNGCPVLKYAKIATIPDGEQMYDILYWNSNTVQWVFLHFPHNEATEKYQVIQHKTDGTLGYDWIRLH